MIKRHESVCRKHLVVPCLCVMHSFFIVVSETESKMSSKNIFMGIKVNFQRGFLNRRQIENFKATTVCLQYNTNGCISHGNELQSLGMRGITVILRAFFTVAVFCKDLNLWTSIFGYRVLTTCYPKGLTAIVSKKEVLQFLMRQVATVTRELFCTWKKGGDLTRLILCNQG